MKVSLVCVPDVQFYPRRVSPNSVQDVLTKNIHLINEQNELLNLSPNRISAITVQDVLKNTFS